jgi:septal ring factor EnvC (AmiA/AmiB activator)
LIFALAIGGFLTVSFSCTPHPNDAQIKAMEETRQAALDAERKVEELKQNRQQLEGQLSQSNSKVDGVKKDKAATEQRVQNWEGN